jgi:hypothetical protein
MRYLALKLGCCFSATLYICNYYLFRSAWTAQYDNKIIGFITEVQFMAGEIFSSILAFMVFEAHAASYSMGAGRAGSLE